MKKLILHVTNWTGYLTLCGVGGKLVSKLFEKLFGGFLKDEDYANNHPWVYLLGVIGILLLAVAFATAIVWYPLTKLMHWIDSKIEKIPDEDEFDD